MKKSGLHKQIASIFDGGPQSGTEQAAAPGSSEVSSASSVLKRLYGGFDDDGGASAPAVSQAAPAAASTAGITADPAVCKTAETAGTSEAGPAEKQSETAAPPKTAAPAVPQGKPMPLPKVKVSPKLRQKRESLSSQVQKKLFGGSGADPHQKKMAILAGGLAVVFGVVLFFSLGGVSGSYASSSTQETPDETAGAVSSGPVWVMPEALPDILRDPMRPATAATLPAEVAGTANPEFVVKGIMFSQKQSSALINDQIIREGEEFNGIKVVRISKTEVEFEADGRRWTQPVRP